jgi:hypothetical protein
MSTHSKLNPRVREARYRRRAAVKKLTHSGAQMLALSLDKLRRMPHLIGEQKEQTFLKALRPK